MPLQSELARILAPDRVLTRWIDRLAHANDASVYRLVPRAVVRPQTIDEVGRLLRYSQAQRIPLTFRAAGTSLSGQAVTDGILVDVARHFREVEVLDGGKRVRVQPGVIGGTVNAQLRRYGTKIGPDPASINACMMGGILANNSSGMCCGVSNNAYHTLSALRFLLPGGRLIDTREPDAAAGFEREEPELAAGLLQLRSSILGRPELVKKIETKYRLKNTTGYSLNAFVDFHRPLEILTHLMIGSEGTLGFIAEAELRTVPDHPLKYTGLLFFADVESACAAIAALRDSGAAALELMDRASLRAIRHQPGVPAGIGALPAGAAALLVEYQCADGSALAASRQACAKALAALPLIEPPEFTEDPDRQAALWKVRKGLIPSVGAMRRRGTTFIIEDVVFPVPVLAQGVRELQRMFAAHGYSDGIVFGHAKDGNLHFVLTPDLDDPADVAHYDAFMRELAQVVAGRFGGALKAEHGTGRNMAPFVEAEWGRQAMAIMRELKQRVDPSGLLNPGVILNDDPAAHLAHLKPLPEIEAEADRCIECGFCERHCPSRDLTLTPRQRIVVRRAMSQLRDTDPASPVLRELEADYRYGALDTCAADGMCATGCPVSIDTGALVKRLRAESHGAAVEELAVIAATRQHWIEGLGRGALRFGRFARMFSELAPAPAVQVERIAPRQAAAVYLPSCITRVAADPGESRALPRVIADVALRSGAPVHVPAGIGGVCCGMPYASKGFTRAYHRMLASTVDALWEWTEQGRLPVVLDSSPCAMVLKQAAGELTGETSARAETLEILDGIEFARRFVLGALSPTRRAGRVALHPVCSAEKMQLTPALVEVVEGYAESAHIPLATGCCGFAGDRGFTRPELTAAATAPQAAELGAADYDGFYSSSRTCEIGMTRATGKRYRSFWYLLEQTTRPV